ncbi:MAG: T9SS type A sorting domain-containing protein [Bacteroidia bacterium]|nr:T9SS type A sorting domain-containing protein [Bacteroidia bacterium]
MCQLVCYGDSCPDSTVNIKEPLKNNLEYLGDNIPNPFRNTTIIPYNVPDGKRGNIIIYSITGVLIKRYEVSFGKGRLEINLEGWQAGVYTYSMEIEGKVVQTKKMAVE